jgi:hypothetical protein
MARRLAAVAFQNKSENLPGLLRFARNGDDSAFGGIALAKPAGKLRKRTPLREPAEARPKVQYRSFQGPIYD